MVRINTQLEWVEVSMAGEEEECQSTDNSLRIICSEEGQKAGAVA